MAKAKPFIKWVGGKTQLIEQGLTPCKQRQGYNVVHRRY